MNILFLHHSKVNSVTGVDVVIRAFMKYFSNPSSGCTCEYMSYDEFNKSAVSDTSYPDSHIIVASNPHIELGFDTAHNAMKLLANNDVISIVLIHDYSLDNRQALCKILRDSNSKLLATGEYIDTALRSSGFDSERIGLGIDIKRIRACLETQNVKSAEPFKEQRLPTIMSTGRIVQRKGFRQLAEVFGRQEINKHANLYLQLVDCPGKTLDYTNECYKSIVNELIAIDSRRFTVHRNKKSHVNYGVASLYVCASSYEGFSMTPIEAAYCGVPPLMSDIYPHKLISHELFGSRGEDFLFKCNDNEDLSKRLLHEIKTNELSNYLHDRIVSVRRHIEEEFSLDNSAKNLLLVAMKCVEDKGMASNMSLQQENNNGCFSFSTF